jgi:hypothetical protein
MMGLEQGCQMVSFQTKNSNLGKFWRALGEKLLIHFMAILEYFTDVWDILWPFGTICVREKSGNPGLELRFPFPTRHIIPFNCRLHSVVGFS